jgi:hypothetical protein
MTRVLISLAPKLIQEIRDAAEAEGFESLAPLVRYLLIQWKQAVDHKWGVKPSLIRKVKMGRSRKQGRPRKPREIGFSKNDEEIIRGYNFYAAYDEDTHTVTRDKPITDKARQRIDALFTDPPKYDAPDKW